MKQEEYDKLLAMDEGWQKRMADKDWPEAMRTTYSKCSRDLWQVLSNMEVEP